MNNKITPEILNDEQIKNVFDEYMKADFPPEELKPLSHIYDMKEKGIYECLGLFCEDEIAGYAFIVKDNEGNGLLDYFAVRDELRGKGIGKWFIEDLFKYTGITGYMIIEVEDPEKSADEKDLEVRTRRISFYERAGVYQTNIRTSIYDADYLIMFRSADKKLSDEEALAAVKHIYELMFSEKTYKEKVRIFTPQTF